MKINPDFPFVIVLIWGLLELISVLYFRKRKYPTFTILMYCLRIWGLWAFLNLHARYMHEWSFNTNETFPFYADLWLNSGWTDTLWAWSTSRVFLRYLFIALTLFGITVTCGYYFWKSTRKIKYAWFPVIAGLSFCFNLSVSLLPFGYTETEEDINSLLRVWENPGSTLYFNIRNIVSTKLFLKHFEKLQDDKLPLAIHGMSHPPGAMLSFYWPVKVVAAEDWPTHLEGALTVTALATVNLFIIYMLALCLSSSHRVAVLSLLLLLVSPGYVLYSTFAHEFTYSIFFGLALIGIWKYVTGNKRSYIINGLLLGSSLAATAMLSYSWVSLLFIYTFFFGLFYFRFDYKNKKIWLRLTVKWAGPVVLCGALLYGVVLEPYRMNYYTIYQKAKVFVCSFYNFERYSQHVTSFAGGIIGLAIMMGPASFFLQFKQISQRLIVKELPLFLYWVVIVTGLLLIFLIVPSVRIESGRCWNWIVFIPIVLAAKEMNEQQWSWRIYTVILGSTAAISIGMRATMVFWG